MTTLRLLPLLLASFAVFAAEDPPVDGEAPVEEAQPPGEHVYDIALGSDLHPDGALVFAGLRDNRDLAFGLPSTWEIQGEAELHLELNNAELLQADASSLTVMLNDLPLVSVPLGAETAPGRKLVAAFPSAYLKTDNLLSLRVAHHYGDGCADPYDPALWSRVADSSFLRVRYDQRPVATDLTALPAPFIDGTVGPIPLSIVLPYPVDAAALDALATVGLLFGRVAGDRDIEVEWVSTLADASHHALLIGQYDDHPEIAELVDSRGLTDDTGLVAMSANPNDPTHAVLVLTGRTVAGVRAAANAVVSDGSGLLSGNRSVVQSIEPALRAGDHAGAPARSRFTLSDLGYTDTTVSGFYPEPIEINLQLEGNAAPQADASVVVQYAYSAGLDNRVSSMTVAVDGVAVGSIQLHKPSGEAAASSKVRIPRSLVRPSAVVSVRFELIPRNYKACENFADEGMWGTVFASTSFDVEREHYAQMPDLSLLGHDLWPFTLDGDDGRVGIVVPNEPTTHDAAAVLELGRALGRTTRASDPQLYATTAAAMVDGLAPDHLIVLHSGTANAVHDHLARRGVTRIVDNPDGGVSLTDGGELLTDLANAPSIGTLEQVVHPDTDQRSILVVRPARPEQTSTLARVLRDGPPLSGNIALVPTNGDAPIRSLSRGPTRLMGERDVNNQLVQGLSTYWQGFFLLLLGSALLFVTVVSLWARRNGART